MNRIHNSHVTYIYICYICDLLSKNSPHATFMKIETRPEIGISTCNCAAVKIEVISYTSLRVLSEILRPNIPPQ